MATIEVDGRPLEATAGEMLIRVTDRAGIYIPRFCYHEKLSIAANCRMCLVEVERAPKPLPACATPVMDGMKVFTQSKLAREAQKGTMEFLLINHPLDCPVCDQGGECPLQDQAMGYGKDDSRFMERKRTVSSHDIGPLVATEMTRCIHCTRCVRFGEEVAGVMEMGAPGRGEYTRIGTFLNQSVDSEVSGNMIDLCPVGALTSKPYRFAARSWELQNHFSISPHDCVGTNLNVQTLRNQVERILPVENPAVNECWLADRDRYSYEAVNSEQRLRTPMIRDNRDTTDNGWREVDWETALCYATAGIRTVINTGSADQIGGLASATSTLEEFHLFQKLIRALGSDSVDHRLQQCDFSDDDIAAPFPASERPIADYSTVHSAVLVGSNLRKEQPLLALRLRQAALTQGAKISTINILGYPMNFDTVEDRIVSTNRLVDQLATLAADIARLKQVQLPDSIRPTGRNAMQQTAEHLCQAADRGIVIVGAIAQQHQNAAAIKALVQWICETTGASMAVLPPANAAAGWIARCLPGTTGLNAADMMSQPRRAYVLLAVEPELDCIDGKAAAHALKQADFVVQISAFKSQSVMGYADVLLPMAAFTESAGTYINCEGRVQQAQIASPPTGDARPAWKILRVMGNFLELSGFDHINLDEVTREVAVSDLKASPRIQPWRMPDVAVSTTQGEALRRLLDIPMYRIDPVVRHATALQHTADNPTPAVRANSQQIKQLALEPGETVIVKNGDGQTVLPLIVDERVPARCVYIPAGYPETVSLGGHVDVTLEKT